MGLQPLAQRVLASHAHPRAFVDKAIAILGRLGYRILDVGAWDDDQTPGDPELLIVDESRQRELTASGALERFAGLPRIVLTRRHRVAYGEPGVVCALRPPARLNGIPVRVAGSFAQARQPEKVQQVFEDTPRTTPRIDTDIAVRCARRGDRFDGSLLSISENGGLLRCDAPPPLGACFDMSLDLPGSGTLSLRAEAAYQLLPNIGVVFSSLAAQERGAIGEYVSGILLGEVPARDPQSAP